jgi:formylglycine-generating enzyme required for sulfatase activity
VVGISWHEATRYCEWLGGKTGGKFRLPTDAEWERAARGCHEAALFPWGDYGVATGIRPATTRYRPYAIPAVLRMASGALLVEDRGVTTSRSRAAPPVPVFHPISDMRITVFASHAISKP